MYSRFFRNSTWIKHTMPKAPQVCPRCPRRYGTVDKMCFHLVSDHMKKKYNPFECPFCSKEFSAPRSMWRHVKEVHKVHKSPHTCSACLKTFIRKEHLQKHLNQVHQKQKGHICNLCEQSFAQVSSLNRHIRSIHITEKKFQCKQCPATFARKDKFEMHVSSNKHLITHECQFCKQTLSFSSFHAQEKHYIKLRGSSKAVGCKNSNKN